VDRRIALVRLSTVCELWLSIMWTGNEKNEYSKAEVMDYPAKVKTVAFSDIAIGPPDLPDRENSTNLGQSSSRFPSFIESMQALEFVLPP
jgi:hypothetical protein